MSKIVKEEQGGLASKKAVYVKAAIQVNEVELVDMLAGSGSSGSATGTDAKDGGYYGRGVAASRGTWGDLWEKEE